VKSGDPLTDGEIAAIRRAHEMSTPGHWFRDLEGDPDVERRSIRVGFQTVGSVNLNTDDARFIVVAHAHLPRLLDELEDLRAKIAAVRKAFGG
jgi:hypothetical protein